MTIDFTTPADSIAGLTIASASDKASITIRDLDKIPSAVNSRDCPILIPDPTNLITDIVWLRESQGSGAVAMWTITFNMHYVFLYSPAGAGRGIHDVLPKMITDIESILDAIIENDAITGVVDLGSAGIGEFGVILDPVNEEFLGTSLTFAITQFKN